MESTLNHEVLKLVFPLLGDKDLVACMLVSKLWQEIALDDSLWKSLCAKICPSMCKKKPPIPTLTYHKLYKTISNHKRSRVYCIPKLSSNDLEFYFDIRYKQHLICSRVVQGSLLRKPKKNPPTGFFDVQEYKLRFDVEQRFDIPIGDYISFCVIVFRKDSNQVACLINRSGFDCIDHKYSRAIAFNYLGFSPAISMSCMTVSISLLYTNIGNGRAIYDVFGIELDFCADGLFKAEVMSQLEMIDWQ